MMAVFDDLVKGVVESALREILGKTTGTSKRVRRRKAAATPARPRRRRSPSAVLREIEKLIRPAKRQTSRKRTVRARSRTRRRSV